MKSLISLLVVVLVVYALSQWLIQAKPVPTPGTQTNQSTSEAVRNSLNQSTDLYQDKLEKSLNEAGVDN